MQFSLQIDQWKEFTILQENWTENIIPLTTNILVTLASLQIYQATRTLPSYKNHDEGFAFQESSAILANTTDNFKSS